MQTIHTKDTAIRILDPNQNIDYLNTLIDNKGLLKVVDASFYKEVLPEHRTLFCYKYGFYCLPTTELANWIKDQVDLKTAIEIGAGHGALARYLNIPATDSRFMEQPDIAAYYELCGQPVTKYPKDIIKLDAVEAIKKYQPETVIGCWVTHKYRKDEHDRGGNVYGIDEDWIIENVKRYIIVGNEGTHAKKRILKKKHKELKFPWLYSRSPDHDKNIIYVWEK